MVEAKRRGRYVPLSRQPLVLVLCQVRFSTVQVGDYIPKIQEEFRRKGFPIERAGKVQQLILAPGGGAPIQSVEQQRWEYRTRDECWSILVMPDSVVLQTTAYERFEGFAEQLRHSVDTVFAKTEHDRLGVVHRVGLRYIDAVRPRTGEDYRFYLRDGFHGIADDVFQDGTQRLHVESAGRTQVGEVPGTMVVRVVQNDQGLLLPPDLVGGAPKQGSSAEAGELITLIDIDHYVEGNFDPDARWMVETAYEMHDQIVETLHKQVATEEAIAVWK